MAGEQMREKCGKIIELFKNMSYETKDGDLDLAKQWKNSQQTSKKLSIADLINMKLSKNERIQGPSERTILLEKFANLIEKSMELICQIYAIETARKDTKKGVQVLIDYLKFYATCTKILDENEVTGDVLCIFEAYVYPGLLGMVLGPTLALGNKTVITVNNQPDFLNLLSQLATKAGYPTGTITILYVEKVNNEFGNWNQWKRVYHFGFDDISDISNLNNVERLLTIRYGHTPMIVFDSADPQSACEVLIDAVWAYNGQLPWSVDTVFVQENIWDNFLAKLKRTINQRSSDFQAQKIKSSGLDQMISDAKTRGIEIYQGENDSQLVAFIGQRVYETNVIRANNIMGTSLTVLPFRTLNEGIALANNNRQGIAASVWGENISQVKEATRKLIVGTIWINSFSVFRPSVSFEPWKESGFGYFGGVAGLLEHHTNITIEYDNIVPDSSKIKPMHAVAASSQINWLKSGYSNRSNTFLKLIEALNNLTPKSNDWITAIYKSLATINIYGQSNTNDFLDYDLKSIHSPIGIIAIEDISDAKGKEILFTALLLGNVMFINSNDDQILTVLVAQFPHGVVNTMENISEAISIAHESNVMIIVNNHKVPAKYLQKCRHIDDKSIALCLTRAKSVWTSYGETYC